MGSRVALNATAFLSSGVVDGGLQCEGNGKLLQLSNTVHTAHGMTSLAATSVNTEIEPIVLANGGTMLRSFAEQPNAMQLQALTTTNPDTSKTTTSSSVFVFSSGLKSGTGATTMGAGTNLLAISDYPQLVNKWIVDADGDTWQTGVATFKRDVEADTSGTGTPNALVASTETLKILTNEGTTALNAHALPTAAAGLQFTFYVQDADGIRVIAATGDTIRIAGSVSATAGRIDSTTVGDSVTIVAMNATEWVAIALVGTGWTVT
jgi:hypothetical protein